ncbi:MAG: secretin N-terminal domain-containing protein [Deltaproteobacteria bacterium]|nr:secretin N-terminal domain-containing protein [Deltaproteobacteria bacterium]
MENRSLILMACFFLLPVSALHSSSSLSDLASGHFEKELIATGSRNPFAPAELQGEIDLATLSLEGLILGRNATLALVSGRIVRVGDKIGKYNVSKILLGEIVLTSDTEEYHLKMEAFVPPLKKEAKESFIEFHNADLKDALKMLATAADYNLIMPEDIGGRVNLSFDDATIRDASNSILKVNNYNYAIESGIMRVGKPDQFAGGTDLQATTIPLKYATAKDLVDKAKPLLSDKGSVTAIDRTNVLSVKDYDANVDSVRRLVEAIDKKDQQVLIEAHIIDATNNFSRSLGIQWGSTGNPSRVTFAGADNTGTFKVNGFDPTNAMVNMGAANPTSGTAFRIGMLPGNTNIDVQLTAAEQRGDIRIISKPNVSTINNMPAKIRSGVKIYVKSTSNISIATTAGSGGGQQPSLQLIETGVQLNVTPQISPEDTIKLTIDATESQPNFALAVDGIPSILDNTASTTVLLKDGETAVIGGLIKTTDSKTQNAVPGISKVPILGLLFKNKTTNKQQNELMVFITPRILR